MDQRYEQPRVTRPGLCVWWRRRGPAARGGLSCGGVWRREAWRGLVRLRRGGCSNEDVLRLNGAGWAVGLPGHTRAACLAPARRRADVDRRAARASALVRLGELSAASRALTAEPLADGNAATLAELRDLRRRPQTPVVPLSPEVLNHVPAEPCPLPDSLLLANLRTARHGSAAGPSGMTNEHLRLMLDDPCDLGLLHQVALRFANAAVPAPVLAAARLGRIVALRKPTGRLRALVVGDVFRRLVARALAQHFAAALQDACTSSASARVRAPRRCTSSSKSPLNATLAPPSCRSTLLGRSTMSPDRPCSMACARDLS